MMDIPLSKPDITDLEKRYVMEVIDSGQLSIGQKTPMFENHFCTRFKARYAVAMNSGTSALHVAVKAFGLSEDDEVITTPYSFIASSNCLIYEKVRPVFVDINPETLNMDTSQLENKITDRTKAILAVHIFGQSCNMDDVMKVAQKYDLRVIEDACEAIGATWKGKPVGTIGDTGVFAFYPNKQITTGEGGILVTNHKSVYHMACSLRNQGRSMNNEWLSHDTIGYNYRMTELQAAVGCAQMERLDDILKRRKHAAERYIDLIHKYRIPVQLPRVEKGSTVSWFVFVILLSPGIDRQRLIQRLASRGVHTKPYFPSIHLQRFYRQAYGFKEGDFPRTEEISARSLAIPFFSTISAEEQNGVMQALASELGGKV